MNEDVDRPIRVLLVDDHAVVRKGLRALFEREPGMEARVGVLIKPYDLNKIRQALADVQR